MQPSGVHMQLQGTMAADATVRVHLDASGHQKIAVQMDVLLSGAGHLRAHALQLFEPHQRPMAEAKAQALKRGTPVELEADLAYMRVDMHNATAKGPALTPQTPPSHPHNEPESKNLWIQ